MKGEFEWDPQRALSNLAKHGVAFEEAASVFLDPISLTIPDVRHSDDEDRFVILGRSLLQRFLVVAHTDRGDRIRIISARLATAAETRKYERGQE